MCVTFVYIEHDPCAKYKLILVNNRDEFLDRPTTKARWERGILGGRDEKSDVRGTWLCMDKSGRIGNLLAITIPFHQVKQRAPSRGAIPIEYLRSGKGPSSFCKTLGSTADVYNAFQMLCLERNNDDEYELWSLASHYVDQIEPLQHAPGIHGFGNSPYDRPFKKVQRGVELMTEAVEEINAEDLCEEEVINKLMNIATDRVRCFPDDQLKKQCQRSSEICKFRSSLFVRYPDGIRYGTKSHSIILVDRFNQVTFYEKSVLEVPKHIEDADWEERTFQFPLAGN